MALTQLQDVCNCPLENCTGLVSPMSPAYHYCFLGICLQSEPHPQREELRLLVFPAVSQKTHAAFNA